MKNIILQMILSALVMIVIFTFFSPVLSAKQVENHYELSLRQKVEQIYSNEIRNAQRADDVYRQVWTLRHALVEIKELRQKHPRQSKKDEKIINQRMTQIRKMIDKESPCEVL